MEGYSDLEWFKPYMTHNSSVLKKKLVELDKVPWRCDECGISRWRGVKAPLQLDHIDGDRRNCMRGNLRLLCPNCHALTDTFTGRNASTHNRVSDEHIVSAYDKLVNDHGTPPTAGMIYRQLGYFSRPRNQEQRNRLTKALGDTRPVRTRAIPHVPDKIAWPSDDALGDLLSKYSRSEVARRLGVSDTAVKKRCIARGIVEPTQRRRTPSRTPRPAVVAKKSREDMLRDRRLKRLKSMHGTRAGYLLELRLGLDTCGKCRKANTEYTKGIR